MASETQANILLVDDRPENLLAMETILASLGENLIRAGGGREALRFLLTQDVALILLDVQMPELNGFELAELIRERERTQHTPIIFVSAASREEHFVFKGYSLGAVDYLTKPFDPEILKSKVKFFVKLFHQNQEIKRQAALLEKTNSELDQLNAELEMRVERRTQQLEAANRDLGNEVAVRRSSEARLATEHTVTRALADAVSLPAAAPQILRAFCEHLNAEVSCLWLPDENGETLGCTNIETADNVANLETFIAESEKQHYAIGIGMPGHVWQRNAPVWLANTNRGEKYPRAPIAAAAGLHSAIGFPIKIGKKFYGVIEFFTRHPLLPDQPLLNMLEATSSEIGQFIQRKHAEAEREKLLQREKHLREQAEHASRLKDEFLATVSHELRTPLNAILGWGQILRSRKMDADEHSKALDTIYRNAKFQAQLIDDLLDTSRLITGNLRLSLSPVAVIPVIESALDVVRPAAEAKEITLATNYDSEVGTITCDAQRLQQMIWNLLTNAVKFTPSGGEVKVDLNQSDEEIIITVSDSGQGISEDFLPHVFERFRQADGSSTRAYNGLGLGLAIVRHLAELHGGSVTAESAGLNRGATFIVKLPRSLIISPHSSPEIDENASAAEEEKNGAAVFGYKPQLGGIRVLVVDDDADTCEMLTFVLEQWGAEAHASNSASAALKSIADWKPDILLTDISMPGEDGYDLISKIRAFKSPKYAEIPAIALTAMARPEDSEQALSAGFQVHLPKPVDTQKLGEAIVNLTGKTN